MCGTYIIWILAILPSRKAKNCMAAAVYTLNRRGYAPSVSVTFTVNSTS